MSYPFQVSASQIETWTDCKRKWGFGKIDKIRTPQGASAAFGSKNHGILEAYVKHGTPLDFTDPDGSGEVSAILVSNLHTLWSPGVPALTEQRFTFTHEGINWLGYIDLTIPGPIPHVIDYKTTSNLAYAKTEGVLLVDPQALVYAKVTLDGYAADQVDMSWLYSATKKPYGGKKVSLRMTRAQADDGFSVVAGVAREMKDAHDRVTAASELTPNPEACGKYGGCPYRGVCNLSLKDVFKGRKQSPVKAMQQENMNTMSRLAALNAAKAAENQLRLNPPAAPAEQKALTETITSAAGLTTTINHDAAWAAAKINPPESPVQGTVNLHPVSIPADMPIAEAQKLVDTAIASLLPRPITTGPTPEGQPFPPTTGEGTFPDKQPKRARRTAEELKADRIAEARDLLVGEGFRVLNSDDQIIVQRFEAPADPKTFTLYIDCRPDLAIANVFGFIHAAHNDLKAEQKLEDYRLGGFQASGALAVLTLEKVLASGTTAVYVPTGSHEVNAVIGTLEAAASTIVRRA